MLWASRVCRICAEVEDVCFSIFETNGNKQIDVKMKKCLSLIVLKADFKPKEICNKCFVKLNEFNDFFDLCQSSNCKFEALLTLDSELSQQWLQNEDINGIQDGNKLVDVGVENEIGTSKLDGSDIIMLVQCKDDVLPMDNFAGQSENLTSDGVLNLVQDSNSVFNDIQEFSQNNIHPNCIQKNTIHTNDFQNKTVLRHSSNCNKPKLNIISNVILPSCTYSQETKFSKDGSLPTNTAMENCSVSSKFSKNQILTSDYDNDEKVSFENGLRRSNNIHISQYDANYASTMSSASHESMPPARHDVNINYLYNSTKNSSNISKITQNDTVCSNQEQQIDTNLQKAENKGEYCVKRNKKSTISVDTIRNMLKMGSVIPTSVTKQNTNTHETSKLETNEKQKPETKPFQCPNCEKSFMRKLTLTAHLAIHTNSRPYVCSVCQKAFPIKWYLTRHQRIHTDLYCCHHCSKSFVVPSKLTRHLRTHTGERPFACPIKNCGRTFSDKRNLVGHQLAHTDVREFICGVCKKGFKTKSQWKDHRRVHSDEAPFQCDICNKTYKWKTNLLLHLKKHKGYVCTYCKKDCEKLAILLKHRKECKSKSAC